MKALLERDVDKLFYRRCQLRGILCIKVASISNRGLPDRLLIGPGQRFGFVEVKRHGSKLTALQQSMLARLEAAGVWARVLWGAPDREKTFRVVEKLLDSYQSGY